MVRGTIDGVARPRQVIGAMIVLGDMFGAEPAPSGHLGASPSSASGDGTAVAARPG
ncbi:hypothetical protein [Tersicoccus solisilvae]|uniref:hypothetical protein n=1 Tax=Tersicoccus solisilvae TaxID=1882339 RepID=UPI0016667EFC|nr:hypothetical protein [Tersicoccus solisilvae]